MRVPFMRVGLSVLFLAAANLPVEARPATVWLMPSEEAEARATSDPAVVRGEIIAFNEGLLGGHVRVLNTLPPLDAQLLVVNPAFAVPNWAWVKNQKETIRALQRFAAGHHVDIDVRFQTWDQVFRDLQAGARPDVVQIGTTWASHFALSKAIVSRSEYKTQKGDWQDVSGVPACVLPYINDIRLLFYWKRLPTGDGTGPALSLNASNWDSILNSLSTSGQGGQLAFAGGRTLNLLMDYSMLVWAGGGEPITPSLWGYHADLTSEKAILVPRLLANAARFRNGRQLVAVPEESHQALSQRFAAGDYRATIEPANFISRWKKDFDKAFGPTKRFWDFAAVAAPSYTFRGGSYLTVMAAGKPANQAFELAEFLASDDSYTRVLAQNAQLPSLRPGFGMDVLVGALGGANDREAGQFTNVVQQATLRAKSLPDIPNWPTEIESAQILEALQKVWRRIGEGDLQALDAAAAEAETELNLKIDPRTQIVHDVRRFGWLIGVVGGAVLAGFVVLAGWRNRTFRRLVILLHVYRGSRHENVRILGKNLRDLVGAERDGSLAASLVDTLDGLAEHYIKTLGPYISSIGDGIVEDIQGRSKPAPLDAVVREALAGARAFYTAEKVMSPPPSVSLLTKGLDQQCIERFPTVAIAILQEWFLNCLRAIPQNTAGTIFVECEKHTLILRSHGSLTDTQIETLSGPCRTGPVPTRGRGLEIIRDLACYAFRARVLARNEGQNLRFEVTLPLKRSVVRE